MPWRKLLLSTKTKTVCAKMTTTKIAFIGFWSQALPDLNTCVEERTNNYYNKPYPGRDAIQRILTGHDPRTRGRCGEDRHGEIGTREPEHRARHPGAPPPCDSNAE